MDHRFTTPPQGWLAGGWWDGDRLFCKWEYDLKHRLLFVDCADEFCIESLSDSTTGKLEEELPKAALGYAQKLGNDTRQTSRSRLPARAGDGRGITTVRERAGLEGLNMKTAAGFRELSLHARLSRPSS